MIVECIFAYRRSKKNKVCRKCGGVVGKDTRFCRVCGEEVHRVPLWLPETEKREKQSPTVITAKLVAMGICTLITISVVTIYRSAATTVFMQLRDQELVSAERLYDGSVSDSSIQKKYLSFLTERYIKQVNSRAELPTLLTITSRSTVLSLCASLKRKSRRLQPSMTSSVTKNRLLSPVRRTETILSEVSDFRKNKCLWK